MTMTPEQQREQIKASLSRIKADLAPPPMTPERVIETGRQFGQKIGRKEAKVISAALRGWRG